MSLRVPPLQIARGAYTEGVPPLIWGEPALSYIVTDETSRATYEMLFTGGRDGTPDSAFDRSTCAG